MYYLKFLERVHWGLAPPTYLEIGVRHGDSIKLARARAIGIDPAYKLRTKLRDDVRLYRETSDEFFARAKPPFGGRRIAMSFIDGMHLAEFVVRDFANVERHSDWSTLVVFDDILPRTAVEAARDRRTRAWTGDVYKALDVLATYRPDLICLRVDTEPTGLGVVLGLDPENAVLRDRYDEIVRDVVRPDPQDVPERVIARVGAVEPEAFLASSVLQRLRYARAGGLGRERGLRGLRRALRKELGVSDVPTPVSA